MIPVDRMQPIDRLEDELILSFRRHPVLARVGAMPREHLVSVLLQRRFLSLAFTPVYELALDALADEPDKEVLRCLLRNEYDDGERMTHRERLTYDLAAIGATRAQILESRPSSPTLRAIESMMNLVVGGGQRDEGLRQIAVLAALRFGAEVLVAVEYEALWPHLERLGLSADEQPGKTRSQFYHPHMIHDARAQRLAGAGADDNHSHSDVLTARLRARLASSTANGLEACLSATTEAHSIKVRFYDQWLA
jgi:hypothetical protein